MNLYPRVKCEMDPNSQTGLMPVQDALRFHAAGRRCLSCCTLLLLSWECCLFHTVSLDPSRSDAPVDIGWHQGVTAMQPIVHLLSVAGSSSQCARCTAMSKQTKKQCGRPALKVSKTQKCQFHGGRGSGPKTPEGRQRVAQAHTVHGRETRQIRQERSQSAYWANL